jgi:hypothetical protein
MMVDNEKRKPLTLGEARFLACKIMEDAQCEGDDEGVDLDDVMDLCEWILKPKRRKKRQKSAPKG